MKIAFTFLFFFSLSLAYAQFSKADAKITATADGPTLALLMDSTKIAIGVQQQGWYQVTFKAIVPKTSVNADSVISAEVELLNTNKKPIGKTQAETKVQLKQAEGRGLYKYYEVLITGYIKGTNLHYRSIPERGLEEILNDPKVVTRQEKMLAYFKTMGFKKDETEAYTVWVYLDDAGSLEQPTYRTIVILRGETALFCIVSRTEILSLEKLKDQKDDSTGHYFFYARPNENNWQEVRDIVYGFIPL
jgi:hypothetical protein